MDLIKLQMEVRLGEGSRWNLTSRKWGASG